MSKRILVIQNAACEHLGTLRPLLEDGFVTDTVIASEGGRVPSSLDGYSALIILGGPASANDPDGYLRDEEKMIRTAFSKNLPALGICLGSQLMAKAAGARVTRGPRKEIGWYRVVITDEGMRNIFSGLGKEITVFQWHGDTYGLPDGAVPLARSELYPVQAFRYGGAYGIQFHLEVSRDMVTDWLNQYRAELESVRSYISADEIVRGLDRNAETLRGHSAIMYRNFRNLIK